MKFKKILVYSTLTLFLCSCDQKKPGNFSFRYSQAVSNDYTGQAYYTDEYFKKDSTEYNQSLATSSLCFAMSAFASNSTQSYSNKYINVQSFLERNGFSKIDVNQYFKVKPTADSLGVCFGMKQIDGVTLIAAGIRGAGYEMEWASNLTIGDGEKIKQHQGFYEASSIYLESLHDYLKSNAITGSIKLWSVGYSRAAATNNLACGRIDQRINENKTIFDDLDVTIKKENLFAYCFECPQGASWNETISPKDKIYSNIHNIINSNDPVPMVAMSAFHFTRYGVDYYLPDSIRNSNYSSFEPRMLELYNKLDNRSALGDYVIDDFNMRGSKEENLDASKATNARKNWTSGLFLNELLNNLSTYGIGSVANYFTNIQTGLRTVCEILFNNSQAKFSLMNLGVSLARIFVNDSNVDIVVNNLFHDLSAFKNDLLYALKIAFDSMGITTNPNEIIDALESLVSALVKTLSMHFEYFFVFLSTSNIKALAQAHFPELCFSHMMALDTNYNDTVKEYNNDGSYYYLQIPDLNDKTKITITNKEGKQVAGLDAYQLYANGTLSYAVMENTFVAYIPVDEEYTINIENGTGYDLSYFDQRYEDMISYKLGEIKDETFSLSTETYPEKKVQQTTAS